MSLKISGSELIGLVLFGAVSLSLIGLSIPLMLGKGAWLVAGYNTMSAEEKAHWDGPALARFTGKILLIIGLLTLVLMPMMCVYKALWLTVAYTVAVVGLGVFAAVWCNTGNRFRK